MFIVVMWENMKRFTGHCVLCVESATVNICILLTADMETILGPVKHVD